MDKVQSVRYFGNLIVRIKLDENYKLTISLTLRDEIEPFSVVEYENVDGEFCYELGTQLLMLSKHLTKQQQV